MKRALPLLFLVGCADTTSNLSIRAAQRDPTRVERVHQEACGTVTETPMRRRIDDVRGDDMPIVGAVGLGVLAASLAVGGGLLASFDCVSCRSPGDQLAVRGTSVMLLGSSVAPLAAITYMAVFFKDRHRYEPAPAVRRCVRERRTAP